MLTYPAELRSLLADEDAAVAAIDAALTKTTPEWLAWEVPTLLLELERGSAPVCADNQARIRGLYALHLTGECFISPKAFEALAWLFEGVEAAELTPHPVDLLHVFDAVRAVAAAHREPAPAYAPEVLERVAELCRQEGYITLPRGYDDVQALIRRDLGPDGLEIEKKAEALSRSALSPPKLASESPFDETPEGIAAARCVALELLLRRRR